MAKAKAKSTAPDLTKHGPSRSVIKIANPETLPDQYIVYCSGDCMAPAIPDGAPVLVKHETPKAGDLAVLFFKPEHVPAGEHQAILKRMVLDVPPYVKFPFKEHPDSNVHALVVVEMDNPPKQFAYKAERLLGIHKCLGRLPEGSTYDEENKSWFVPPAGGPKKRPSPIVRRRAK